jgi:predicted metal-dependent hydrolase
MSKLSDRSQHKEFKEECGIHYGCRLPYRGHEYFVVGGADKKELFQRCFCSPIRVPEEKIQERCIRIYQKLARQDLRAKADEYAKVLKIPTPNILISRSRTKLSRCSETHVIFSWRLLMGSESVIDYVVASTLAMRLYSKESPEYTALLASIFPNLNRHRLELIAFEKHTKAETRI